MVVFFFHIKTSTRLTITLRTKNQNCKTIDGLLLFFLFTIKVCLGEKVAVYSHPVLRLWGGTWWFSRDGSFSGWLHHIISLAKL